MLDFGYYNVDCMEGMKEFPDGFFDLAIVDPPYGIEKGFSALSRISKYGRMDIVNDARPNQEYFNELFRVSKNQIVWGFNHLSDLLPTTKEFIFWYKHNPVDSYSDGELAWTSFTKTAKCFDFPYWGGTTPINTVYTQHKNPSRFINGYWTHTRNQATKFSTPTSEALRA